MELTLLGLNFKAFVKHSYFSDGARVIDRIRGRNKIWLDNPHLTDAERIFPIYSYPGAGKTWLLKYLAEAEGGIYLDFADYLNSEYERPESYLSAIKEKLPLGSRRQLLLLDHVPPPPLHPNLRMIEDEILAQFLRDGAMLIVAQQNRSYWCWRFIHPEVHILRGLDAGGKEKLFRAFGLSIPRIGEPGVELFQAEVTLPFLVKVWKNFSEEDNGAAQTSEYFLRNWLKQVGVHKSEDEFISLLLQAGALTWLDALIDQQGIATVSGILGQPLDHMKIRDTYADYQWAISDNWVDPVIDLLQVWLRTYHEDIAQKLDQEFGGQNGINTR